MTPFSPCVLCRIIIMLILSQGEITMSQPRLTLPQEYDCTRYHGSVDSSEIWYRK
jgi:hypothetical protein